MLKVYLANLRKDNEGESTVEWGKWVDLGELIRIAHRWDNLAEDEQLAMDAYLEFIDGNLTAALEWADGGLCKRYRIYHGRNGYEELMKARYDIDVDFPEECIRFIDWEKVKEYYGDNLYEIKPGTWIEIIEMEMGYSVHCIGGNLEIKRNMVKKAIELLSEGLSTEIPDDKFERSRILCQLINERDTCIRGCLSGAEVTVKYNNEKKWDSRTEDLYELIAPVVDEGSWVVFKGEDGNAWRYDYWSGKRLMRPLDPRHKETWHMPSIVS